MTHGMATYTLESARSRLREDFLWLHVEVARRIEMPAGHHIHRAGALGPEVELTWFMNCEVRSAQAGLSIHGGLIVANDEDDAQVQVEVRYFHPTMLLEHAGRLVVLHENSPHHRAMVWVYQGLPLAGNHRDLTCNDRHCSCAGLQSLADSIVSCASRALERRADAPRRQLGVHAELRRAVHTCEH